MLRLPAYENLLAAIRDMNHRTLKRLLVATAGACLMLLILQIPSRLFTLHRVIWLLSIDAPGAYVGHRTSKTLRPALFAVPSDVTELVLNESEISEADVHKLFIFDRIRRLDLANCRLGSDSFTAILKHASPIEVNAPGATLDDGVGDSLAKSGVVYLDLSNTKVSDRICDQIARMKRLRSVKLAGTQVTSSGISKLILNSVSPSFWEVDIYATSISKDEVAALRQAHPDICIHYERPCP